MTDRGHRPEYEVIPGPAVGGEASPGDVTVLGDLYINETADGSVATIQFQRDGVNTASIIAYANGDLVLEAENNFFVLQPTGSAQRLQIADEQSARLKSPDGNTFSVGDSGLTLERGNLTMNTEGGSGAIHRVTEIVFGTSTLITLDPGITTGSGAPAASAVTGNIYLRDDGGNGTTFYVKEPAGWRAIGVIPDELVDLDTSITGPELDGIGDFFNGTLVETMDALVSSNGTVITLSLEQDGGGDLTMRFSDGTTTLDCTPAVTATLTAGTDTVPQANYCYIPQSTKTLTVSTTGWPAAEHIKICYVLVRSASTVQTEGPLVNQNWNDHREGTDGQGHMSHMAERSRRLGAVYYSGVSLTPTIDTGPTPDELDIEVTSGTVYQMHKQTFPAFDTSTGDKVIIVNHPTSAYTATSDLETQITNDSTGSSMSNSYFNLVIWGAANKSDESFSPIFANLPSGSYNKLADATNDVDGYDVYTIPDPFFRESSVGFLISRLTFKFGGGTNTLTHEATTDLRGFNPFTASGAGGTTAVEFPDSTFRVFDDADSTKELAFEVSGLTTATTRTLTVPDESGTVVVGTPLTSHTPTWTSTGTAPAIGNGTLAGEYFVNNGYCTYVFYLLAGSTTTYGTGNYRFDLPVAADTAAGIAQASDFTSTASLANGATHYGWRIGILTSTTCYLVDHDPAGTAAFQWAATTPFTFGTGDIVRGRLVYKVA